MSSHKAVNNDILEYTITSRAIMKGMRGIKNGVKRYEEVNVTLMDTEGRVRMPSNTRRHDLLVVGILRAGIGFNRCLTDRRTTDGIAGVVTETIEG
ncbi:hypothetical protein B9Z55_000119 [Caenorhabditis nigoni]|uniref:Uncharacterized protein n=1 Tax=Caenorhabditis nigoni TaxID=1611254 RepID=A0A2G5VEL0_9PELO|nr:hypothetical protein B9Z55_000119 [Caenorhabditis nigoni]